MTKKTKASSFILLPGDLVTLNSNPDVLMTVVRSFAEEGEGPLHGVTMVQVAWIAGNDMKIAVLPEGVFTHV